MRASGVRLLGGRLQAIIDISSIGMRDMARSLPFSEDKKKLIRALIIDEQIDKVIG